MKRIYIIIFIVSACLSCTEGVTEKHQMESLPELFDSLMNREEQVYRSIYSSSDSTYFDEYWFHYFYDDSGQNGKESTRLFLTDNMTELLDRLCKKAEKSYRYCTKDSLDYSITMSNEPMELVSYKHYQDEEHRDRISFTQTNQRPAKSPSAPYDAEPIHTLLQKFIAEQKDMKQYKVRYEWDEGVPFPSFEESLFVYRDGEKGPDSLAASTLTGTHYIITAKGKGRIDAVSADFAARMFKLITEHPIQGVRLQALMYPGKKPKERTYRLQRLFIIDEKSRRRLYEMPVQQLDDELHILEVNTADVPRYAFPYDWATIIRTHNEKIYYRDEQ